MRRYAVAYLFSSAVEDLICSQRLEFFDRLRNAGGGIEACLLTGQPYCPLYEFESDPANQNALVQIVYEISIRMTDAQALPPIKFLGSIQQRNRIGIQIDKHWQITQAHRIALHECSCFARTWTLDELRAHFVLPQFHDGLQSFGYPFAQGLYCPYVPFAFVYDNTPNEHVKVSMAAFDGFTLGSGMYYGATISLLKLSDVGSVEEVLVSAPALAEVS